MTAYGWMPAKRLLRPIRATSGLIKGEVAIEPAEDLLPGFSASGQDVWLEHSAARASGPGIVLSAVGARCGKTFLADFPRWGAVANTASFGIAEGFDAKYVHYILNDENFWTKGGAAQPYVMIPESLRRRVWAPPLMEQRAIADYLDRETAQIDAFIAKNEELITLLTERRGAVIARAVLRGLDASAELRDSGVTWLGEVPSHWRVSRLSRWFEVTLGKMLDEAKFAGTVGDVLPYVRASNIKAERLDLSDVNSMPFTPSEQVKFSLRNGDLVVVEGGSIGVNAHIEEDMHGWGFQKTVNRVRAIRGDLTRFLGYQIDVIREADVLNMITNVSTIQHLTAEKLERIVVAMPPIEEQEAIVSHIRRATSAIDRAVETAVEGVRLARERRAALISAAVTGKIDVGVSV